MDDRMSEIIKDFREKNRLDYHESYGKLESLVISNT